MTAFSDETGRSRAFRAIFSENRAMIERTWNHRWICRSLRAR